MPRIILQSEDVCAGCGCELHKGENVWENFLQEIFCEECEEIDKN